MPAPARSHPFPARFAVAAVLTLGLLLALATSARAASIWTPLSTGTTEDISAIDYQSDAAFFFTTSNGGIFQRTLAGFVQRPSPGSTGVVFSDIAMRGSKGLAVGAVGKVYKTTDGGLTWLLGGAVLQEKDDCSGTLATAADLYSVRWKTDTEAWVFGAGRTIASTADTGTTFTQRNVQSAGACRVPAPVTDAFFNPGATDTVYLLSDDFGGVYLSTDALAGPAARRAADAVSGGSNAVKRLAGDPTNPNRQWAVNVHPTASGTYYLGLTQDAWTTRQLFSPKNFGSGQDFSKPFDVGYAGGSVVEAGDGGQINTSIDGVNFFNQPADGALATTAWRALGVADGSHAAVGGQGGKLVVSDRANTIPDIVAPTGTISGAATVRAGKPATFTAAVADNAGGSGVDPNGFAWTTPGQTPRGTGSATYTFPDPGPGGTSQTISLTFRDLAGNAVAEPATKTVSILQAAKPTRKHPGLTLRAKPKRDKRAPFKFSFSGAVKPPQGTSCAGKVKVSVAAGRRTLKRKTVTITAKKCTYKVSVSFKSRNSIRKAKKLNVSAIYGGSSKLTSAKKSITVSTK